MTTLTEADVEQIALEWLNTIGWTVTHGPDIAPDASTHERSGYDQVVLERRLHDALAALNPDLPDSALDDAFRRLTHPAGATLEARNRAFHRLLVDGVTVEYPTQDGSIRGAQARVVNFENPDANSWLAVNQFTVSENKNTRRADIVLFLNGLPLAVIELKKPGRRGRHHLDRLEPAPDLQGRVAHTVQHERGADRLRRDRGPHRCPHRPAHLATRPGRPPRRLNPTQSLINDASCSSQGTFPPIKSHCQ